MTLHFGNTVPPPQMDLCSIKLNPFIKGMVGGNNQGRDTMGSYRSHNPVNVLYKK